jgi:PEP-CTERM motif-containing protein
MRKILFLLAAVALMGVVPVSAQVRRPELATPGNHNRHNGPTTTDITFVDPQLFVCNGCTSSPTPNDPVLISLANVHLGVAGNDLANVTLTGDVIVIIGVPNGVGTPTITCNSGCTTGLVTVNGSNPVMTSSTNTNAFLAFGNTPGADGSENWTNWSGAPGEAGVTSFTLYEFDLGAGSTAGLAAGDLNITINGVGAGTIVIGYAAGVNSKSGSGVIFSTPFTVAGDATGQVPEPGTLALLGTGMLSIAGAIRRRKKQNAAR